jgi:sulfide dehydrogenase cytochrome subunit
MTLMIRQKLTRGAVLCAAGMALGLGAASAARAADGATLARECQACHGGDGASSDPQIPTIGGLSAKYIAESLKAFRKKQRPCTEVTLSSGPKQGSKSDMCRLSAALSDADVDALARHLAGRKFVRAKQPFDAGKAAKGDTVYQRYCNRCHEKNGSSPDEDNGILAGQWTPYLKAQLAAFRAGKRPMDDRMKLRLDNVGPEEEDALLQFFASQQ